jgi:uncharacterized protein
MSVKEARRTELVVIYKGANISKDISTDLVSFSYTDNESGKADDIDITLQDSDGKWSREWAVTHGDKIEAKILYKSEERNSYLDCGTFIVDNDSASGDVSSGTKVSIKATSLPQNNTVRRTQKNRAWEGVRLSEIATDVANTGQLRLTYATDIDPIFERKEQINKSDLGFLESLINELALSLKVTKDQIVIFNRDDLEKKGSIADIVYGENDVISWSFEDQTDDTYSESTAEYKDPKTGKLIKHTEKDDSVKTGKVIKATQRVENQAEAERIAKANLKNKNRKKRTGSLLLIGDVRFVSGNVITIIGFGKWDGEYYIDTATHDLNDGYTVSLDISSTSNPKKPTEKQSKAKTKAEKAKKIEKV